MAAADTTPTVPSSPDASGASEFDQAVGQPATPSANESDTHEFDQAVNTPDPAAPDTATTQPDQPQQESLGVGGYLNDLRNGIRRGQEDVAHGLLQTLGTVQQAILPESMQIRLLNGPLPYSTIAPETLVGHVAESATQMAMEWGTGSGVVKGLGLAAKSASILKNAPTVAKGVSVLGTTAKQLIGSALVGNTDQERLSNMVHDYPWIGPAASLIMQNPHDSNGVARAKMLIENTLPVAAGAVLFKSLHLMALKSSSASTPAMISTAEQELVAATRAGNAGAEKTAVAVPSVVRGLDNQPIKVSPGNQAAYSAAMDKVHPVPAIKTPSAPVLTPNFKSHNDFLTPLVNFGKTVQPMLKSNPAWSPTHELGQMADFLGKDTREIVSNFKMLGKTDEEIGLASTGIRQYITNKAESLYQVAGKAHISQDAESLDAFKADYQHFAEFQGKLVDATSETKIMQKITGRGTVYDPTQVAKLLDDPEKVKDLARLVATTDGDANSIAQIFRINQMSLASKVLATHNEAWLGLGLLSRFGTHAQNLIGNPFNAIMHTNSLIAGGTLQGITGNGFDQAAKGLALYGGYIRSIHDAAHIAWQGMKTDRSVLSPALSSEYQRKAITSAFWNLTPDSMLGRSVDVLGNITRSTFKGLAVADEFSKQLLHRGYVDSAARTEAFKMVKAGTMDASEVGPYVAKALKDSVDAGGASVDAGALRFAEKITFTNNLKEESSWFGVTPGGIAQDLAKHDLIRGSLLPFVKTPTNIMRTNLEYTPGIGMLRKQFIDDVRAGGERQATALGKQAQGAAIAFAATALATNGVITGPMPPKGVITPKGWQPYSFDIPHENGDHTYISYANIPVIGWLLQAGSNFAKASGEVSEEDNQSMVNHFSLAVSELFNSESNALKDQSVLRTTMEFLSAVSGNDPSNTLQTWLGKQAASHLTIGAISQFNQDDTQREVNGFFDSVYSKYPGLSSTLPAKRDYLGEVNDIKPGYPAKLIPFTTTQGYNDPVRQELNRLTDGGSLRLTVPSHTTSINGAPVDLRNIKDAAGRSAYDYYQERVGTIIPRGQKQNFYNSLNTAIHQPSYRLGHEDSFLDGIGATSVRGGAIKQVENTFRDAALEDTKNRYAKELGIQSAVKEQAATSIGKDSLKMGVRNKQALKILDLAK